MDEELDAIRKRRAEQLRRRLELRQRGEPLHADLDRLDALLAQHPLVLVDLWAPWCGPCRRMEPVLASVAQRFGGDLLVAKVNVDENPKARQRFAVQGVPTLLLFADAEEVQRWVGLVPEPEMVARLETELEAAGSPKET